MGPLRWPLPVSKKLVAPRDFADSSLVAADLSALGSNKAPPLAECGAASGRSGAPEQGSLQGHRGQETFSNEHRQG